MKRHIFSGICAFLTLILLFCASSPLLTAIADTPSGSCGENVSWSFEEDSGTLIISGSGAMTAYEPLTPAPWSSLRAGIKALTVSDGVTEIGNYAFLGCNALTRAEIPESVVLVGEYAFSSSPLLESISLPSVTSIGTYAFSACSSLVSVSVPSLISLAPRAFNYCASLKSISLPACTASIGDYAFFGCSSLNEINTPHTNTAMCSVDGVLYNKAKTAVLCFPSGKADTSFTFPQSVTAVGNGAFVLCENLTEINLSPALKTIGAYAFYNCSKASGIIIPLGVTVIDAYAFSGCNAVTSFTLPDSLETIGDYAFSSCISLSEVELPNSLKAMGEGAFYLCNKLSAVVIPASVSEIEKYAFLGCTSLTDITVDENNSTFVSADGVLFTKNMDNIVCYPAGHGDSFSIPQSVTSIGDGAFSMCEALTEITIPASVISVSSSAFSRCPMLEKITVDFGNTLYCSVEGVLFDSEQNTLICYPAKKANTAYTVPATVTALGDWAFYGAAKLASIALPTELTAIGARTFYQCGALKNIYYAGTKAQWDAVSVGIFNNSLNSAAIHYNTAQIPTAPLTTVPPTTVPLTTVPPTTVPPTTVPPTTVPPTTVPPTTVPLSPVPPTTVPPTTVPPTTVPLTTVPPTTAYTILTGDVNGDGKVKANDARIVLRVAADLESLPEQLFPVADINGDGKLKANDARIILRIAAGLA